MAVAQRGLILIRTRDELTVLVGNAKANTVQFGIGDDCSVYFGFAFFQVQKIVVHCGPSQDIGRMSVRIMHVIGSVLFVSIRSQIIVRQVGSDKHVRHRTRVHPIERLNGHIHTG